MKQASNEHVLISALLTTALIRGSYGLGDCSIVEDVGTDFSISSLSCVNYNAEFSWHVQLRLADTLLQLTCHNGTHDYSPVIIQTTTTSGSESYLIPLEGTVQCELGGCYEDKVKYDEWLIPETNFSCPPPVSTSMASSAISSSSASSGSAHALTTTLPSPTLSYTHMLPVILPTVTSTLDSLMNQTEEIQSDSQDDTPGPTQTPVQQSSGLVAVIHVLVPLSVLLVVVVLAIFGILCAWEINKLIRTKSVNVNLHKDDKPDPSFSPSLQNYSEMCISIDTNFEVLTEKSVTVTPTSVTATDSSSLTSQNTFPSLLSTAADDLMESGDSTENSIHPPIASVIQPSQSHNAVNITNIEEVSFSRNRLSTKSYMHVNCSATTCDDPPSRHLIGDAGAPHFSISDLVHSVADEQWNGHDVEQQVVASDMNKSDSSANTGSCFKNEEDDNYDGGTGVRSTPILSLTNEPVIPQLSHSNDLDEGQGVHECEHDNEVAMSFVEQQSVQCSATNPLIYTRTTSSGISSGTYICSLTTNDTEH